jgi:hypothetical protein
MLCSILKSRQSNSIQGNPIDPLEGEMKCMNKFFLDQDVYEELCNLGNPTSDAGLLGRNFSSAMLTPTAPGGLVFCEINNTSLNTEIS